MSSSVPESLHAAILVAALVTCVAQVIASAVVNASMRSRPRLEGYAASLMAVFYALKGVSLDSWWGVAAGGVCVLAAISAFFLPRRAVLALSLAGMVMVCIEPVTRAWRAGGLFGTLKELATYALLATTFGLVMTLFFTPQKNERSRNIAA